MSNAEADQVPYRVDKPWGHELIWARTDRYVGKILHIEAGHLLSLQYHERKDETIHVLRGRIVFRVQDNDELVERGGVYADLFRRQQLEERLDAS